MMRTVAAPRANPYVGPRPFAYGEPLYGREREQQELLDLLIAERIVLLYSPSGAGKTSLIQAALIPALRAEGFEVLPPLRVGLRLPTDLGLRPTANRYLLSLLLCLEEALPEGEQTPLAELAGLTLAQYLDRRRQARGAAADVVLILDHLEEILALDPTDRQAKEAFFIQLGEALRDHHRWALLSLREEYVAGLDPYRGLIPTRLSTTYRLELLAEEQARQAAQGPARAAGVDLADAAALKLVDELRRVRVQLPDGTTGEQPGPYIEPVQLQIVCRGLWDRLAPDDTVIDEVDVEARGGRDENLVDRTLKQYYSAQVSDVATGRAASGRNTGRRIWQWLTQWPRQWRIRRWFDRGLITRQGIRAQVLRGPRESEGLANDAIEALVGAYLVRADKQRGATWYELTHDRFIEPIQEANAEWRRRQRRRIAALIIILFAIWHGLMLRTTQLQRQAIGAMEVELGHIRATERALQSELLSVQGTRQALEMGPLQGSPGEGPALTETAMQETIVVAQTRIVALETAMAATVQAMAQTSEAQQGMVPGSSPTPIITPAASGSPTASVITPTVSLLATPDAAGSATATVATPTVTRTRTPTPLPLSTVPTATRTYTTAPPSPTRTRTPTTAPSWTSSPLPSSTPTRTHTPTVMPSNTPLPSPTHTHTPLPAPTSTSATPYPGP